MKPGDSRRPSLRVRLVALLLLPVAIVAIGRIGAARVEERGPASARDELERQADRLRAEFRSWLSILEDRARARLEDRPEASMRPPLSERIDGAGVVTRDGVLDRWTGTPFAPEELPPDGARVWQLRTDGASVRCVLATPQDETGRRGVATLLLHAPLSGLPISDLLPDDFETRTPARFFFEEPGPPSPTTEAVESPTFETPGLRVTLSSPDGAPLAWAVLQIPPAPIRAARLSEAADAVGALLFSILLAPLLDWRVRVARPGWLVAVVAAAAAGRAAWLLAEVPGRLLPRELGSPSIFGGSELGGLVGSPADLFATALAVSLVAFSLAATCRGHAGRRPLAVAVAAGSGSAALAWAVAILARFVAEHARVPVLDAAAPTETPAVPVLLVSLGLLLAAAADLAAAAALAVVRRLRADRATPSRWSVASVAIVPLAALAAGSYQASDSRVAAERLRVEIAPQVVEQETIRETVLRSAVSDAAGSWRAARLLAAEPGPDDRPVAYRLWATGELFRAGTISSLDLFDAEDRHRSHFGFDLPRFDETRTDAGTVERLEDFRIGALVKRLLHAEAPVLLGGRRVGTVVGHVLQEPENLPFVPWTAPYLAALGPDPPAAGRDEIGGTLAYVLYDANGDVLLHTLGQPPSADASLRRAASAGTVVRYDAGPTLYRGIAIEDRERIHLLLLPSPGRIERLAAAARLAIAAWLVLCGAAFVSRETRLLRVGLLVSAVRRSFYRKLLASVLLVSLAAVALLAILLQRYVQGRADAYVREGAADVVSAVQRVVEDYGAVAGEEPGTGAPLNDEVLAWLRRVVGHDIHLYEDGRLLASSKRELFTAGLLVPTLPGEVDEAIVENGAPFTVLDRRLGTRKVRVAYAPANIPGGNRGTIVAVPLLFQPIRSAREITRITEALLLASLFLAIMLAGAAALIARAVAGPVGEMVQATARIASGDYTPRLRPRTRDEIADLVIAFNGMADALARQRTDLERRRDYIEALLGHATTGVLSTDAADRIVTANPAAAALIGGGGARLRTGKRLAEAFEADASLAPLARALAGPPPPDGSPTEIDLRRGDEVRRWRVVRVPLPDPDGGRPGSLVLLDDVTELMRSNQLSAWAEMARSIAHEIKNPLTPIQLSTEHIRRILEDREVLPSPELDRCLSTVMKQVRALREIAAEFSTYAKLPTLRPEPTDPAAFVDEVLAPYLAAPPEGVRLETGGARCPEVPIDRKVLGRALVNLIENAFQAMPGGGTLHISTFSDGEGGAVIEVADSGEGLGPEARDRLFEPYFSTKSSGTGLGLAIVRRAVEGHGGRIDVRSEPGRGTSFRIRLPAAVP